MVDFKPKTSTFPCCNASYSSVQLSYINM